MGQESDNKAKNRTKIFTIPNVLSFFRICLIPLIVWLYCMEHNFLWAGYTLVLSGITDMADGYIARHFDMVSDFGKALDPIADKLTQAVMLICLLIHFPIMIFPLILMGAKEIFMGVTGILIIRKTGNVLGAEWHGKVATCLLYGVVILHMFWQEIPYGVSVIATAACAVMIGVSFMFYGVRNVKVLI